MADSQGIMARALVAVKYLATGSAPANWFGPLEPLQPMAPPEVAGRQYDYPVGFNLNITPRSDEPIGFPKLKALAKNSDLVRMVLEGQKDKLETLEWAIKPREDANGKRAASDASVAKIQAQLEYPDGIHDWAQWLRMLLEQLFVLDAVSIYRRRTLGGAPYSFELLDGATIKVLLDPSGRRPAPPSPAFQQILKGVPAVDYTAAELLYYPQNPRADHAYGFSRVEMIITTVETSIERMKSQKSFFTHGNLADGFFEAPEGVQPDQVRQIETMWNNLVTASVENRRIAQFLPGGFKWNPIGQPPLQDMFDEWLIRLICFVFSASPTPFLKQQGLGHGSAQTDQAAAEAAGTLNVATYIRRLMNRLLAEDFQRPDLEFAWVEDREFDPKTKADIEDLRLRNGSLTLDEVRDRNGEDPLPNGLGKQPLIYTAAGATLLDEVINPSEPEPVVPPPALGPDGKPLPPTTEPKPAPDDKPLAKAASTLERKLGAAIAKFLAAKGDEIATALGDKLGLEKAAPSTDDYSRRIEDAFDEIDWDWTPLAAIVQPAIAGIAVAAGKNAVSDLGLFDKATLSKMTATATSYAESRAAEMVGRKLVDGELVESEGWSIPSATRDMIRSAVTDAMENGASNDELAKAIREDDAFSKARATTIARTETAGADYNGAKAGWQASGLVAGEEWSASPDCCDECQAMDGEIIPLGGEFSGGSFPLHPNDRCAILPVLPEDMPDTGDEDEDTDEG